ncbi:TNT domain-containing protein [Ralstonia solanacearum]|uniref:TNT domain-containing protein n=1 Tax=Ralstonia pseudosolanacearum TaxID=1310165 RepID=UPI001FFD36CB
MQDAARNVVVQAGNGDFVPAGRQVGQDVGTAVVGTAAGVAVGAGVSKTVGAISSIRATNAAAAEANNLTKASDKTSALTPPVSNATADKDYRINLNARTDDAQQYTQYQKEGSTPSTITTNNDQWNWPSKAGFAGEPQPQTVPVGKFLGRLGDPNGSYLAPAGTPLEQLSLAPGSAAQEYHLYEVTKPLPTIQGIAAPAFGQPGGGTQMLPNFPNRVNVDWLLNNGYLKEVTKR